MAAIAKIYQHCELSEPFDHPEKTKKSTQREPEKSSCCF
jgi:hypothetical protein